MDKTTLKPIWKRNLKILFIGQSPAKESAKNEVYFSSRRKFWELLYRSGLTDDVLVKDRFEKGDDKKLLDYGFGITDLLHQAGIFSAKKFNVAERERLEKEIQQADPKIICFLGKKAYQVYKGTNQRTNYGWQEPLGNHEVFVAVFPTTTPETDKSRVVNFTDLKLGFENSELIKSECLCKDKTCAKCLIVNCSVFDCKVHEIERKYRSRLERGLIKKM